MNFTGSYFITSMLYFLASILANLLTVFETFSPSRSEFQVPVGFFGKNMYYVALEGKTNRVAR